MLRPQIDFHKLTRHYFTQQQLDAACVFVKDTKGRYQYHNNACSEMLRALKLIPKNQSDYVGANDSAIYGAKTANFFHENDQYVMASGQAQHLFETLHLSPSKRITESTTKIPLYVDGKLYGILGKVRHLNWFYINNEEVLLSERELQILAFTYFGLPAAYTANQLSISSRTVETHLTRVKVKFSVTSKIQLMTILNEPELAAGLVRFLRLIPH